MARNFTSASSQYLSAASAPVTTTPFTMACWFRTNGVGAQVPLSIDTSGALQRFQIVLAGTAISPNRSVIASLVDGTTSSSSCVSSTTYTDNTWNHVAAVFTSSTSRNVYLNGGGAGTDATSVAPSGLNQTLIGARTSTTAGAFMSGDVAEVAFWNVALTPTEIAALGTIGSNGGVLRSTQVRPESLVFYDPLDDLWTYDRARGLFLTDNAGTASALDPPQLSRGRIPTPMLFSQRDPGNYRFFFSAA